MTQRDPRIDPATDDVVRVGDNTRTIIYTTVYGRVYYKNSAGSRRYTDLNTYRFWAKTAEVLNIAPSHSCAVRDAVKAEVDLIRAHYTENNGDPGPALEEALLEFGIAYALGSAANREKVYAVIKSKGR